MEKEEIIKHGKRIISESNNHPRQSLLEAVEFLRDYAGENSSFFKILGKTVYGSNESIIIRLIDETITAYLSYLDSGLHEGLSIERSVQIHIVSDILDQANLLLQDKKVHPAAPTIIIGCGLEEFLRTWIEEKNLSLGGRKKGIDSYSHVLLSSKLINKQDVKDITSWAGLRNHAAHGEWDLVDDRKRVGLMLEGVNLFMRKYSK